MKTGGFLEKDSSSVRERVKIFETSGEGKSGNTFGKLRNMLKGKRNQLESTMIDSDIKKKAKENGDKSTTLSLSSTGEDSFEA